MRKAWTVVALLALTACATLYQDDLNLLVSAQANSPEFPVYLNGHLCKDAAGSPGACSMKIRTTDTLSLHFDAQVYPYVMTFSCTSPMHIDPLTVAPNQPADVQITPSMFAGKLDFICIGEAVPQDGRPQTVSANWEVRIVVADTKYIQREDITFTKDGSDTYVNLGQYAKSAWVFDGKAWKSYEKTTSVKLDGGVDQSAVRAYSQSFQMRFNYLNMDQPVEVSND